MDFSGINLDITVLLFIIAIFEFVVIVILVLSLKKKTKNDKQSSYMNENIMSQQNIPNNDENITRPDEVDDEAKSPFENVSDEITSEANNEQPQEVKEEETVKSIVKYANFIEDDHIKLKDLYFDRSEESLFKITINPDNTGTIEILEDNDLMITESLKYRQNYYGNCLCISNTESTLDYRTIKSGSQIPGKILVDADKIIIKEPIKVTLEK